MPPDPNDLPATELPVYWFLILERAAERGDFEAAAQAQKELERLGVTVRFVQRRATRQGGADAK